MLFIVEHLIPLLKETKPFSRIWIEVRSASYRIYGLRYIDVLINYKI